MKQLIPAIAIVVVVGAVTAGVVLAQLSDGQTASGSINGRDGRWVHWQRPYEVRSPARLLRWSLESGAVR